ncbi:MAG TPA: hypothetical protein VFI15_04410 [Candidatus Limnocylindrales bacterium]|nr:hypothetical protein [Candidatus Limnocylindrales bacterium]
MTRAPKHRLALLAAVVVAALTVAACGEDLPSLAATAQPTPEPTAKVTTYELGTKVWYEGLEVEVVSVTSTLDARGGPVEVVLRMKNPTDQDSSLDGPVTLLIGTVRADPTRESEVPEVPAGGSAAATLTYELQGIASIDLGRIEIGAGPLHVASVPITPFAGTPVVFEPQQLALRGNGASGTLKITLKSGVLRSDLPDWSQELDAGLQALTITYDATYTGTFSGGFAFTGDNVALKLPNGTVVEARRDGHSQSVELIGATKNKAGLSSRFEIPAGLTGTFNFLVRNGSSPVKAIPFTIG